VFDLLCDDTLTLSSHETICYAFGIIGKPSIRSCACWSRHKFQTNGAKVIEKSAENYEYEGKKKKKKNKHSNF
jgi:hypothetical protein